MAYNGPNPLADDPRIAAALRGTPQYAGSIPTIAQAYQNDPRTKLAQAAQAIGTSTAPVAQGGWGIADGLARAASAVAGAYINKGQEKKFAQREQDYTLAMQQAAARALMPQQNPAPATPAPAAPQPQMTPPAPSPAVGAGMPSGAAPSPVIGVAGSPPVGGVMRMDPATLYRSGIRPIEGGTDPRTGAFRTSPKGAVGPGQIMPGTGPEAARLAGLPWDEKRYRSDTQYNDALGQAYYAKQLQDFGDPLKAAAAYNAGPGRVRRAIRRAASTGGDYTQHLPGETQNYVQQFAQRVGAGADAPGGGVPAATQPLRPGLEEVPDAPQGPAAERPQAPGTPREVQTNRIAMAQDLLKSGNPDLVAIAQQYLDKGLDEQNAARMQQNTQQFQQSQTGYQSELADYNGARSDQRQNAYGERRDAQGRNFQRQERYAGQTFQAGESAADRTFRRQERVGQNFFDSGEADRRMAFQASEAEKDRANSRTVAGIRADGSRIRQPGDKNPYYDTPTGLKMQEAANQEITKNNDAIAKLQQYMDLNERVVTGGIAGSLPGRSLVDKDFATMDSLAKETTLAALGGSLGTAISDGDRKFISEANVGARNPQQANRNIAQAKINGLRRASDRAVAFGEAQANGVSARAFNREWSNYVNSNSIVQLDRDGNVQKEYVPFDVWKNRGKLRTVK